MQSIKSGGGHSAVSELKGIMELASNPERVKAVLQELESKIKSVQAAEKSLNDKSQEFLESQKSYEAREKELEGKIRAFEKTVQDNRELELKLGQVRSDLVSRERFLASNKSEFEYSMLAKKEELDAKEKNLEENSKKSLAMFEQGKSLEREYGEKLKQLKSITG